MSARSELHDKVMEDSVYAFIDMHGSHPELKYDEPIREGVTPRDLADWLLLNVDFLKDQVKEVL